MEPPRMREGDAKEEEEEGDSPLNLFIDPSLLIRFGY
jgi:hypothetical protein